MVSVEEKSCENAEVGSAMYKSGMQAQIQPEEFEVLRASYEQVVAAKRAAM